MTRHWAPFMLCMWIALTSGSIYGIDHDTVRLSNAMQITSDNDCRLAADVNGDGFDDLVAFDGSGVSVRVAVPRGNNGLIFDATRRAHRNAFGAGWNNHSHLRIMADVNNDNRADIIGFGNTDVYLSLSECTGTTVRFTAPKVAYDNDLTMRYGYSKSSHPRFVDDVNGDGLGDIIAFANDGVYVALGTIDLFQGFKFANKVRVTRSFATNRTWTSSRDYLRTVADVDKDGRADIVGFHKDAVYIAFSEAWFAAPTKYGPAQQVYWDFCSSKGWRTGLHERTLADVNGDGLLDIVGFGNAGVMVAIQSHRAFRASTWWVYDFGLKQGWDSSHTRLLHDMNGDGSADIVGIKDGGVYVSMSAGLANTSDFDFFAKPSFWMDGLLEDVNPFTIVGTFNHRAMARQGGIVQFHDLGHTVGFDLAHCRDEGYFRFLEWRLVERRIDNFQRYGGTTEDNGASLDDILAAIDYLGSPSPAPNQLTVSLGYGGEAHFGSFASEASGVFCSYNFDADLVTRGTFVSQVQFGESMSYAVGLGGVRSYQEIWGGVDAFEGEAIAVSAGKTIKCAVGGSGSAVFNADGHLIGWGTTLALGINVGVQPFTVDRSFTRAFFEGK